MKCDELQQVENPIEWGLYYDKDKVDAAIDELKEELYNQKWRGDEWARNANDKDKQIAEFKDENRKLKELEEKLKNSRNARKYWRKEYLIEYKECCHQKYKRCLAMAEWCDAEADVADADGDYEDMRWYQKWHKRWLAIAEQFKPNSTAQ